MTARAEGVSLEPSSLWVATAPVPRFGPLSGDRRADVAVVGAGIVGLTTASLLRRAGLDVVLVEADEIAAGASTHSTVKVTVGHGLVYSELRDRYDTDTAASYLRANQVGMATIRDLVEEHEIDCDLEERRHVIFAEDGTSLDRVRAEVDLERELGLPAEFIEETDLPFAVVGALALEGQAQFHPRRYLAGLADAFVAGGGVIHDGTRVLDVEGGAAPSLQTDRGTVDADHVVLATGIPIVDRKLFFAKVSPRREYAVAAALDRASALADTYYSAGTPRHSLRMAEEEGTSLLIVVGESHKTGEEEHTERRYAALTRWLEERFPIQGIRYRWSTQDYDSVDGLPYAGYAGSGNVLAATGFGGWGMTNGTAAAVAIANLVMGEPEEWADVYDVERHHPAASAPTLVRENAKVAAHWIGDRLSTDGVAPMDIGPGEAAVTEFGGDTLACYRDDSGALYALSAVCTHLGCIVSWNAAERSWDCPCHGSRFGVDGAVLQAPATEPLAARSLDDGSGNP
jgi:glycine/D-amino acid oxidase-like deaminating enzyme/nitrite reductase/ring-hydroxylating ferredoxin subunit